MEEKYFEQALGNFTADVAYVKAVRHLYDLGMDIQEIKKECLYPVTEEKIEKVIEDYEKEKNSAAPKSEFVQVTDKYGRKSFIKREKK